MNVKITEKTCPKIISMLQKYPNKLPILIIIDKNSKLILDHPLYLVDPALTVGMLLFNVRKRLSLSEFKSLYMFINNTILPTSQIISQIYFKNYSDDGYLRIHIAEENTFG